jgi:hypothetical protein
MVPGLNLGEAELLRSVVRTGQREGTQSGPSRPQ